MAIIIEKVKQVKTKCVIEQARKEPFWTFSEFKKLRKKVNMGVPTKCSLCGNKFEDSDNLCIVFARPKNLIVCENCNEKIYSQLEKGIDIKIKRF